MSYALAYIPIYLGQPRWDEAYKGRGTMATERFSTLQDVFLKHVCDNRIEVQMFLVNGVRLQGYITWFDKFIVQLSRGGTSQIVYKHAISAINPEEPVQLPISAT
jgi:host factor-I protein